MVMNAIVSRHSVRKYDESKNISENDLSKILEAGRLAPSWVNVQPWKFIVVRSQKTKDLLFQASGNQLHVKTANVLICGIVDLDDWNSQRFACVLEQKGLDKNTQDAIVSSSIFNPSLLGEYEALLRSVEQLTYATAYMTLEAQELGIGCCIVGAFSNELTKSNSNLTKNVKEALGLTNHQIMVNMLTLGFPTENATFKKLRKSYEAIVYNENLIRK